MQNHTWLTYWWRIRSISCVRTVAHFMVYQDRVMSSGDSCTADEKNVISSQKNYNTWKSGITLNLTQSSDESSVTSAETAIASMLKCINTQDTIPTSIQNAQWELSQLQEQYYAEIEDTRIAKERVDRMRNPEQHVSFYEGWFPMDKPLKKSSIPILIAFSILFFTLFLGFILATMTVTLSINFEFMQNPWFMATVHAIMDKLWIVVLILIGVIIWLANK